MSVRRWGAAAIAAAAALAFAFACKPFDGDSPTATNGDAATSSSSGEAGPVPPNADAGGDSTRDGSIDAAGDGTECFDFTDGQTNGFALTGSNAQSQAGGIRLVVEGSTFNMMQRTFHRDGGITTTRVGVDMTITGTLPGSGQFLDTILLFYGLPTDYQKTPQTGFELVEKGSVDVNIWGAAASSPYQHYTIDAAAFPYGHAPDLVWIDSVWNKAGAHIVAVGDKPVATLPAQLADQTKTDFTIRLGGEGFYSAPATTILVRRVCVRLQ